jgi:hypothetical protein
MPNSISYKKWHIETMQGSTSDPISTDMKGRAFKFQRGDLFAPAKDKDKDKDKKEEPKKEAKLQPVEEGPEHWSNLYKDK